MRLLRVTAGDVRLQWKSGFYGVYAIFTAVYVLALAAVPVSARQTVATVMIFTDPAAMGLFFMGALVLLEKGQGVNLALAVSPVRIWEYCAAKLMSLSMIGLVVALILALTGGITAHVSCLAGVLLSSILFSACGLIAASLSKTLNQFVLLAVPFVLLLLAPLKYAAGILPSFWMTELVFGGGGWNVLPALLSAALLSVVFAHRFRKRVL